MPETLAEKARKASFPTQLRSPAYEKLRAEEEARKAEAAAEPKADPGVAGSGYVPPAKTAAQLELEKQAEHGTETPEKFDPNELRKDQLQAGVSNYVQTGGQLVGMTPGGWMPHSRGQEQSVTGPKFSPETQGLLNQAAIMEAGANRNLAAVEGGRNLALQGIEERRAQQEAIYAEGRAKRDEFHQRVVKARRDKLSALEADVANSKVDPRRMFKDMNAGQLALFGLGGILASIGAGFSAAAGQHGPSPFIEQMRMNIQNDIAAQEHDIAKKERGVERQVNALDALQRTFGDRETAVLALENLQLKAYENATKQMELKYANTALAPKLQLANAQIVKMLADNRMKMEAMTQYKADAQGKEVFAPPKPIYAGGAPGGKRPKLDESLDKGLEWVHQKLGEAKVPEREAIMHRFIAGIPERSRSTVLNLLRSGDVGRARQVIGDSLAKDPGALAQFEDGMDQLLRMRTGAAIRPEEKGDYERMLGLESQPDRVYGILGAMQGDIDREWNRVRVAKPDIAAEWEIRNRFYKDIPQTAVNVLPKSAARK